MFITVSHKIADFSHLSNSFIIHFPQIIVLTNSVVIQLNSRRGIYSLLCPKMVVCQIQVYIWRHTFLVLPVRPFSFSIFRSHHFLEFKALKILWLKRHSSVIFIWTITKMVSCGSNDKRWQKMLNDHYVAQYPNLQYVFTDF